jgi:hypothetical protein
MKNEDYLNRLINSTATEIANEIRAGSVTFEELQETGEFVPNKQREVKLLLKNGKEEDDAFKVASTIDDFKNFLIYYPNSIRKAEVQQKIDELNYLHEQKTIEKLDFYKNNPNALGMEDDPIKELGEQNVRYLCEHYGIDYRIVQNFKYAALEANFNDIPRAKEQIPEGYTDVYFWGTSSSGKTCALAAILSTMNKKYNVVDPDNCTIGISYRSDLTRVFKHNVACLPNRTPEESTQYMPFYFKKSTDKKYKLVSFFELSGELFKYFYEVISGVKRLNNDEAESKILDAFRTVELLIASPNPKLHFFFIDYEAEMKESEFNQNISQADYLEKATTFFKQKHQIFSKKSKGVYIVITKADKIPGETLVEKKLEAIRFLDEHYRNFRELLKNQSNKYGMDSDIFLFSIGDVYFNRICKINREYSDAIIQKIDSQVKIPDSSVFSRFLRS